MPQLTRGPKGKDASYRPRRGLGGCIPSRDYRFYAER